MQVGDIGPAETDMADNAAVQAAERRKSLLAFAALAALYFIFKRK